MNFNKQSMDKALTDKDFLATLMEQKDRELYAKISSLNIEELPIEQIEGRVTNGNINIDGDSNVRRSCSLTLVAQDVNINDYYWGLNTKFKLEIGMQNSINNNYPDIIWFPQGTYVLTTFSTSLSLNNYTISVTGKDKMCLLNGEVGGQIFASVDFGKEETRDLILKPVTLQGVGSTENIMMQQYYIEYEGEDTRIFIKNKDDSFVAQKDKNGRFYKQDNYYYVFNIEHPIQGRQRYKIFEKVVSPEQIIEKASFTTYEKGKYYKEKEFGKYYVISNSEHPPADTLYTIKPLYEINYEYKIKKAPLEKIIRESVHAYAKEPYHNIIINDLDEYGLEQLTYKGDKTLYALRDFNTGHFTQLILSGQGFDPEDFVDKENNEVFYYDNLTSEFVDSSCTKIYGLKYKGQAGLAFTTVENNIITPINEAENDDLIDQITYTVAKLEYGDDIGYRITDLTYTGDLITGIGESLTSVYDKIKQMLGDFEYFYDEYGRFIFRRKPIYVNTSWSHIINNSDEIYVDYAKNGTKFSFNFEGNRIITSVQNTPVLTNVKNDYSVWGKRKGLTGNEIPIHARYAIDRKPKLYRNFHGDIFYTEDELISPIVEDNLINQVEFVKNRDIIPDGLNKDDWFEFSDWLTLYNLKTQQYPSEEMRSYAGGNPQKGLGLTQQNVNLSYTASTNEVFNVINLTDQFIIILGYNTNTEQYDKIISYYTDPVSQLNINLHPLRHKGNDCTCYYTEILNEINRFPSLNLKAFIYNPKIPEQVENITSNRKVRKVDWRELIYRMAIDYFAGQDSDRNPVYDQWGNLVLDDPDWFLSEVAKRNPEYYSTGYTGYEQYYTDMQGFWRELYNPDYQPQKVFSPGEYITQKEQQSNGSYYKKYKTWQNPQQTDLNIEYYYDSSLYSNTDLIEEDLQDNDIRQKILSKINKYGVGINNQSLIGDRLYWNINVFENPETLNFWIEFLDNGEELSGYQVKQIGARQLVVNDDQVKAIVYKDIPDIVIYDLSNFSNDEEDDHFGIVTTQNLRQIVQQQSGYTFISMPKGFTQYFNISYRSKSAKNKIDELLYQHAYCTENISIQALPIYYLEPNTRIFVSDKSTGINGEYIVSKISLPLNYNGTMSITASKAPERLL